MRRPMWKIHCTTVLLLTGINIYLLIKLLHCSEKSNDRNQTGEASSENVVAAGVGAADGRISLTGTLGWHLEHQERLRDLNDPIKGPRKSLDLTQGSVAGPSAYRPDPTLENQESSIPRGSPRHSFDETQVLDGDLLMVGRWDDSRRFVVRDFALTGKQFHTTAVSHNVCLATQSSLDRLQWLGQVADHWRGAMSVAVYLESEEVPIFHRVIRHLKRCHAELLTNLAFHVVSADAQSFPPMPVPAAFSSSSSAFSGKSTDATADDSQPTSPLNCTGPSEALTWLLKERPSLSAKWESGRPYPQNLMRNVARKGCPSRYVLLLDVDVVPSFNMAESLAEFLDRPSIAAHCPKCAFVVPTYELDYAADFPQNKSQLLALENQGRAQPFHQKAFRYNQFASNLTRWRQTSETDQVVISHNVTNYEFFYEPFYMARDEAPPHDERFLGYGFTRNTQVYEMALSGWSFHVLSPVFTIHWGMQMKQRRPAWRKTQMDRNRRLFDVIHHELKAKYGLLNKSPVRWKPMAGSGKQPVFAKSAARTSV